MHIHGSRDDADLGPSHMAKVTPHLTYEPAMWPRGSQSIAAAIVGGAATQFWVPEVEGSNLDLEVGWHKRVGTPTHLVGADPAAVCLAEAKGRLHATADGLRQVR